jgi:p-aminobenzoyl-glutamate transporter AbgT
MDKYGGSLTFRVYALAFAVFFVFHLVIQWILERIYGPHGKKKSEVEEEIADEKDEDFDINRDDNKS